MRVHLIIIDGENVRAIPVQRKQFLIGRGEGCHLRLKRKQVGPTHCVILVERDEVFLEGLGGATGTLVDGKPICGRHKLESGDRFEVDTVQFEVRLLETEREERDFLDDVASGGLRKIQREVQRWSDEETIGRFAGWAVVIKARSYARWLRKNTEQEVDEETEKKESIWTTSNLMTLGAVLAGGAVTVISFMPASTWEKLWANVSWPWWAWIVLGFGFFVTAAVVQVGKKL